MLNQRNELVLQRFADLVKVLKVLDLALCTRRDKEIDRRTTKTPILLDLEMEWHHWIFNE